MPAPLHRSLDPGFVRSELRRIVTKLSRRLRRVDDRSIRFDAERSQGSILFSYVIDPLLARSRRTSDQHTHFWESLTMAEAFLDRGIDVEAISWTNTSYQPGRTFDFLLDVRGNLERLEHAVSPDGLRIAHLDTAHHSFHNPAQQRRLAELQERRGTALAPQKLMPEHGTIEAADVATYLGNEFTRQTYAFARRPMFRVPVSVPYTYEWPQDKDFDLARRSFLWFGSGGLVHKGLDRVLEAFATLPHHRLTVCGPVHLERDFAREYHRELYQLPNIETLGWVSTQPGSFSELADRTLALVYPSCSEGGGSSALTCMHAGIVPILTPEASVDLESNRGVLLADDSIEAIRAAVVDLSERPPSELREMARNTWEFSRRKHTKEHFAHRYGEFVDRLLEGEWPPSSKPPTEP